MQKILEKNKSVELNKQIIKIERQGAVSHKKQVEQKVHENQTLIRIEEQKRNKCVVDKHNKILQNWRQRKADNAKLDLLLRNQNIYLQNELHNVTK